jgi:ankyrin repeat protein
MLPNRPLHTAALNGYPLNIKTLFEAGAKLGARNFFMRTALHHAANEGELEAAQMLIELCAPDRKDGSVLETTLGEKEQPLLGTELKDDGEVDGNSMLRLCLASTVHF